LKRFSIVAAKPLPPGKATLRFEFAYDGGGLGKGGIGKLFVNGQPVGQGRIDMTQAMVFSVDDAADVGEDAGTPVTEDYNVKDSLFTGTIQKVTVALQPAKADVQSADEEAKKNAAFKKAMSD
jgi:arylsulfatase